MNKRNKIKELHRTVVFMQFIGYKKMYPVFHDWREFCILRNYIIDLRFKDYEKILSGKNPLCHYE